MSQKFQDIHELAKNDDVDALQALVHNKNVVNHFDSFDGQVTQ